MATLSSSPICRSMIILPMRFLCGSANDCCRGLPCMPHLTTTLLSSKYRSTTPMNSLPLSTCIRLLQRLASPETTYNP